jgi:stage V sporulation protein G
MEITEVKVFPIQEEKLKAFVSIVFDQCFMVNDIKIIQGRDGLFISMPSRKKKNGEFKDVAHPLNNETRRTIEDRVLGEYERVLGERGERLPAPSHTVAPLAAGGSDGGVPGLNGPGASAGAPLSFEAAVAAAASGAGTAGPPAAAVSAAPAAAGKPAATGAPEAGGGQPGSGAGEAAPQAQQASPEKSLDEIEEMHLRDSFWTVT